MRQALHRPEIAQLGFVLANLVTQVVQLGVLAVTARSAGERGLGELGLGLLTYTLISALSTNGLAVYGARLVGASSGTVPVSVITAIRSTSAAAIAAVAGIAAVGRLPFEEGLVVAGFAAAAVPPMLVPEWLLLGERRLALYSLEVLLVRGVPMAATLVAIVAGGTLALAAGGYLASTIVVVVGLLLGLRRMIARRSSRGSVSDAPAVIRAALPLGIGSLLSLALLSADSLIVRSVLGTEALGSYTAATRPVSALMSAIGLFVFSAFPRAAQAARDGVELAAVLRATRIAVLLPTAVIALVLTAFAQELLLAAFGPGMREESAAVLRLYVPVMIAFALGTITLTLSVVPQHHDRQYVGSITLGVVIVLLLAPPLVSGFGISGGAIAALIGNVVVLAVASLPARYLNPRYEPMA